MYDLREFFFISICSTVAVTHGLKKGSCQKGNKRTLSIWYKMNFSFSKIIDYFPLKSMKAVIEFTLIE